MLTLSNYQNMGTPGVSIISPPETLNYVNLSSKKQMVDQLFSSNNAGNMLLQILTNKKHESGPSSDSDLESNIHTLEKYHKFEMIPLSKRDCILEILKKRFHDIQELCIQEHHSWAHEWLGFTNRIIYQLKYCCKIQKNLTQEVIPDGSNILLITVYNCSRFSLYLVASIPPKDYQCSIFFNSIFPQ